MKRLIVSVIVFLTFSILVPVYASTYYFISGYVYDAYGQGVSGVSIQVLEDVGIQITDAGSDVTSSTGGYGIQVSPGVYTVSATQPDGRIATKSADATVAGGAWLIFYDSDFLLPETPSLNPAIVGEEAGFFEYNVSAEQIISVNVNTTNSATTSMEWIFIIITKEGEQSIFALIAGGWVLTTSWTPLETLTTDFYFPTVLHLGDFSMTDLSLESGDSLAIGYAYSPTTSVSDSVIENYSILNVE